MIRLLRFLFTGSWHEHSWEVFKETKVYADSNTNGKLPIERSYLLKCKECGILKEKKVKY